MNIFGFKIDMANEKKKINIFVFKINTLLKIDFTYIYEKDNETILYY